MRAPAALAISIVASVDWESKTWMSSDQETLARQSGRSRCSLRVRMRTEIICWLWYRDEPEESQDGIPNQFNVSMIGVAAKVKGYAEFAL